MSTVISANIVTGFLGSGKTTLLKSALRNGLAGRKVALIVNDFGDIGVDGVGLQGMNVDKLVELPGGCVCCTVGSRFVLAVQEIMDTVQPHLIVIETSGAAEPGPLIRELSLIGVKTDSVITLADAEHIRRFCTENVTAVRQVEAADFLVLNKIDLVKPPELARVEKFLARLNPRALVIPSEHGVVGEEILFATSTAGYWRQAAGRVNGSSEPLHLDQDRITSFSFQREGLMNRARFEACLVRLPTQVYRAKGIVKFSGEGWSSVFNYTCGRSRVDWLAPEEGASFDNRGVVIGKGLAARREQILKALDLCLEA